ncbi:MAG: hypothetical protein KDA84_21430 [Planctomycetaceae bacterium]|nr:hypothetical protein [Planctomycetaceae bacterium]
MTCRSICLIVIATCVSLGNASLRAEDQSLVDVKVVDDMKNDLPDFVRIIEEFGNGNIGSALDLVEVKLPRPFTEKKGPFEGGMRDHWQQQFAKFAELRPKFESVDLVGYQPISTKTRTLVFVGNGEFGPMLFRFQVFHYRGDWKINGLSYQASWKHIEEDTNFTRFTNPQQFPLSPQPVAQAKRTFEVE